MPGKLQTIISTFLQGLLTINLYQPPSTPSPTFSNSHLTFNYYSKLTPKVSFELSNYLFSTPTAIPDGVQVYKINTETLGTLDILHFPPSPPASNTSYTYFQDFEGNVWNITFDREQYYRLSDSEYKNFLTSIQFTPSYLEEQTKKLITAAYLSPENLPRNFFNCIRCSQIATTWEPQSQFAKYFSALPTPVYKVTSITKISPTIYQVTFTTHNPETHSFETYLDNIKVTEATITLQSRANITSRSTLFTDDHQS